MYTRSSGDLIETVTPHYDRRPVGAVSPGWWRGLKALGPEVVKGLRFVCSDMWKPYLQVNGEEPIMRRKLPATNREGGGDPICSS
jgi:hypothetical protein